MSGQDKIERLYEEGPIPGTIWETKISQDLYPTRDGLFDLIEDRHAGYACVLAVVDVERTQREWLAPYTHFDVLVVMKEKIGWIPYTDLNIWHKAFALVKG